jgi:ABC-type nitrate/sulfonate/bicarbonate transport system substrate-binding protein
MKRIVIGAGAAGFNFLPIFIAQHEKYFGAHGLEVEVRRTGSTEKATAALLAGELNIAITPPEGAILNYLDGGPLRIVGGNLNGLPLALIAQPRYKQIADLRGATFGTSSMTEGTAIYSMEILAQNGLQYPTDYRFSLVGVHTARWEALKHGTLDAALQLIPLNFVAEDAGYNNLAQAYECIPEIAFISIIVSQEWANTNRAALVGVLQAIHAGMKVMHDRASDGLSLRLLAEVVKAEPKYVARSLNLVREKKMMPADLSISAKAFETSVRLMRKAGILSTDAGDLAAVMDDQYRKAAGL